MWIKDCFFYSERLSLDAANNACFHKRVIYFAMKYIYIIYIIYIIYLHLDNFL